MEHGATVSSVSHKPFSWEWWKGSPGQIPIVILGLIIFFVTLVYIVPTPQSMIDLVQQEHVKGAIRTTNLRNKIIPLRKWPIR